MRLTEADLLAEQSPAPGGDRRIYRVPTAAGEGTMACEQPREGLQSKIGRHDLLTDVDFEAGSDSGFQLGFVLSGSIRMRAGGGGNFRVGAGHMVAQTNAYHRLHTVTHEAGAPIRYLVFHIARARVEGYFGAGEGLSSPSFAEAVPSEKGIRIHSRPMTPAMRAAVGQYVVAPYAGVTRRLFLESKAMELLALTADGIGGAGAEASATPALRAADIARIHDARDILVADLEDPPSLRELARRAGVNEQKLKRGFRQAFDTTVFGYLQQHRLDAADALLRAGELNVSQAALAVGYVHFGHFAAAYRKRFGRPPSAVLAEARRRVIAGFGLP